MQSHCSQAVPTQAVTKNPHAVVLLDEIEKAHPEVFNLLLQVMDHGTLTDNNGRKADFRNVVLVMTTNAGAQEMARASIGFTKQDHSSDGMEVIRKQFSPEFRNRLDAIIQFGALDEDSVKRVVDKLVVELEAKLGSNDVTLELDDAAREWIADTTRKWAPDQWRASSRNTSNGPSLRNCYSAALRMVVMSASRSVQMAT